VDELLGGVTHWEAEHLTEQLMAIRDRVARRESAE
jgi:hypothetical protein